MKDKVLKVLKESDDFISGEQLSKQLGVSRTAVWKAVTKLKEEGYDITSVTRKGYQLVHTPDKLTKQEIQYGLNTKIGREIYCYDEIDSTNQQVKRLVLEGAKNGSLVIAEEQTKGKGSKGRGWVSPSGTGIWMSCLLTPDINPTKAPMVTIVAGLAVCQAIQEVVGIEAGIKWPNDIVIQKKKVCGILTEMSAEMDHLNYLVLGIGINVNQESFPEEIKEIATSLKLESNTNVSRVVLLQEVLKKFEKYYDIFISDGDLRSLIDEYKQYSVTLNSKVRVTNREEEIEGTIVDINEFGELRLSQANGEDTMVRSGDVSVRGLYGYV
ncbi:biotin--[acetyl-CoA-carboxylase] ligase [Vallitalea okinawensis]|uniref:biotin--[acetyl-CoA-carboxylase] ligase n=1 Tax=Vallitalea okinawensis TaxID=2078660 RepID=UPI000CFA91C2|nr:biotin--[acetyl-CoA-carboxylase] ligase [Vallitalea okinawensis]